MSALVRARAGVRGQLLRQLNQRGFAGTPAPARYCYEVNIGGFRSPEIRQKFVSWLVDGHIRAVCQTNQDQFLSARLFEVDRDTSTGKEVNGDGKSGGTEPELTVQYYLRGPNDEGLRDYLDNHAARLRQEAFDSGFTAEDFSATRRALRIVHEQQ